MNDGDPEAFVAAVADDAVWLPPGPAAIVGRESIRAWLEGPFAAYEFDYEVSDVRLRLAGDRAVEQARFRTRLTRRAPHDRLSGVGPEGRPDPSGREAEGRPDPSGGESEGEPGPSRGGGEQAGGAPMVHEGTYVILWRRTEPEGWLIERYIDQTA